MNSYGFFMNQLILTIPHQQTKSSKSPQLGNLLLIIDYLNSEIIGFNTLNEYSRPF